MFPLISARQNAPIESYVPWLIKIPSSHSMGHMATATHSYTSRTKFEREFEVAHQLIYPLSIQFLSLKLKATLEILAIYISTWITCRNSNIEWSLKSTILLLVAKAKKKRPFMAPEGHFLFQSENHSNEQFELVSDRVLEHYRINVALVHDYVFSHHIFNNK
jgi:hypothetical protein